MWFLILCLIFIFFYYIFPSLLKWFVGFMVKRQARKFSDRAYRAAGLDPDEMRRRKQQEEQRRRNGGWSSPSPKRRKIDPKVAENISFKEVTVTKTTFSEKTSSSKTVYEEESQITDIKWEDID